MSACETGLGKVTNGEGVLGLRRAVRIAGARHVVMSLWRCSDKEALRQMRHFDAQYDSGTEPFTALQNTQRWRIKKLRGDIGQAPPALWAAFAAEGIPRHLSEFGSTK